MAIDREAHNGPEVNIPSAATVVVAEFKDRDQADGAVDALVKRGIGTDQISLVARGAGVHNGVFQAGVLMLTVHPRGKDQEVAEVLRKAGAHEVRSGMVSATGDVLEESEAEEAART